MASAGVSAENIKAASSASILTTTTTGLAASQTTASVTATTLKNSIRGIKTEIKNLTTDVKNFAFLHPELLALVGTILAIGTAIKIVNAVQDWADGTSDIKKYNKSLEDSEQKISDNKSQMEEYQNELSQNKDKLEELQEAQKNGNITEAQKTEIDNLQYQNALLDEKIEKLKQANEEELKSQTRTAENKFNTQFNESGDDTKSTNAKDVIERVSKDYGGNGSYEGISWTQVLSGNDNDKSVAQLAKLKLATDAYNQAVSDFENSENDVTREDVDNAKETLDILTQDFEKSRESLYNSLTSEMEKMEKVKGTDAFNQQAYDSMKSWLEIFQQCVPEYKKAMDKVKDEAKNNPIEQPVTFTKDPTSLLTESDDKSKTANLADLKSEADTLKSLQKELEDTGVIGVDSMQKIIKQYPEAKEALYDYMTGVKNEAELFADLENIYNDDKSQYINSLVEENQANEDFFASIKQNYPEVISVMKSLVEEVTPDLETLKNKYISDIATEEETANQFISALEQKFPELYNQLADIYDNDKENFIKHVISENETNQDFLNFLSSDYPKLFDLLGTMYGNDVDNWSSMEQAKAKITTDLINQLNALWTQYFEGISDTFNAFGSIMENADGSGYTFVGGQDDSDSYDHNMSEEEWQQSQKATSAYDKVKDKINSAIKIANEAVVKLQDSSYNQIANSIGGLDWNDLGTDSSSSSGSGSDSSDKDNSKDYDLIERKIKKLESAISNLDTAVSDTYTSWSDRNSALSNELSTVADEISLQQQAYEKYMDLANSVGLDEYYQDLIKNGAIDVITVDDENLQDQIDKFQDFYDKAQDCNDKIRDLNQNLKELQKTKFDNVVSQFEDISSSISHAVTMLDKYIDLADKHGYYASADLYEKQIGEYNNTLNTLTNERNVLQTKLQESVQSGLVQEGSETWNDMLQQIQSVNEEIVDTIINIQEVENSLRDLDFTKFERGQDNISNLTSEAQFYIDLIEKMNKDLYDEDGVITSEGFVSQALHAQNYGTYLKQADFYANKLSEIETELANDPANTTLIDKKQEYIEAQRESVLAAYEEKNAIIDLIKDGYDKASDALAKLIDKRKEALEAEKDLHDYQKSVQEKSDKVTELEKQKNAYANDASEEAKSKVQQLEVNLKEAQEDLAETEYDKYISDQEKLLDDLQEEYEQLINERIDNIDSELGNIADAVNYNRQGILDKLEDLSHDTELPLTRAMEDIWISAEPVASLNATVKDISGIITGTTSSVDGIIARLDELISIMHTKLDEEINKYDDGSYNSDNSNNYTPTPTPSYDDEPTNTYSEPDDSDSDSNDNYDDIFEYKHYYSQPLNIDTSVVDRLKYNDINAAWDKRADYYDALFGDEEYTGSDSQNIRMLDWLKEHGYAKGKKRGEYSSGLHPVGENGNEIMIDGVEGVLREVGTEDTIFTNEMTKNLAELAKCYPYNMPNVTTVLPSPIKSNATQLSNNIDNIEIVLPNVKNYPELKRELMNDRNFKKFMSETVVGQALGHNELAANKYK